jgi:hypothetical protein
MYGSWPNPELECCRKAAISVVMMPEVPVAPQLSCRDVTPDGPRASLHSGKWEIVKYSPAVIGTLELGHHWQESRNVRW